MTTQKPLLAWQMTAWAMTGIGTWKQQPVIVIEGQIPFFADHPKDYIRKLKEMYADKTIVRGPFWASIGHLRDGMELSWIIQPTPVVEANHAESPV